ncbi:hypothetical protein Holit_01838 [Hollandina sp. SP2]
MALQKMSVCEGPATGNVYPVLPYQFCAQSGTTKVLVNLVMPFGGRETGFYRYPKLGEQILVDDDEAASKSYYLIGYLPSETEGDNNFLTNKKDDKDFEEEKKNLQAEEGMILRYQQTGKTAPSEDDPSDRYSELGFYRKKTQWKTNNTNYKDGTTEVPRIDRLNIQSTGDISQSAKNFQEIKAKRLELLAGLESYDHAAYPGADYGYSVADIRDLYDEKVKALPFGDGPGDDGNLYAGDMHLRAKNRIILKAGDEIIIEVGRSSIVINDGGITLTTRKGRKKTINLWDTKLVMSPQQGITLFGQNLKMEAVNTLELKENYGGSIKSLGGVMRILGRDIKMATKPTIAYLSAHANVVNTFSQSVAAIDGVSGGGAVSSFLTSSFGMALSLILTLAGSSETGDTDPIDLAVTLYGVLLTVNYAVVNMVCDLTTPQGRDTANKAAMIVDFSLNLLFTAAIVLRPGGVIGFTHHSLLHLRGSAHIELASLTYKKDSTKGYDTNSPLAGYVTAIKDLVSSKVKDFLGDHEKVFTAVKIIGGVVGAGALAGLTVFGTTQRADKITREELQEL